MQAIQNTNPLTATGLISFPTVQTFKVKDPMSALTHFIGFLFSIFLTPFMLIQGCLKGYSLMELISLSIFMLSLVLLYGASTAYHTFRLGTAAGLNLKRMDHMMIFVLIAGTYTPLCLIKLGQTGLYLLIAVWALAAVGMLFKLLWVTCPKWVSSVIYIAMGWVVIFAFPTVYRCVSPIPFVFLLAGGIIYTIGGIIYALKLVKINSRESLWGSHEIFHLFVLGGSLCHFICIYFL